jgi:hypothetical protein
VDEFITTIMNHPHLIGCMVLGYWEGKRGPKKRLTLAELMTVNILRFYLRVHDLKTFHRLVQNAYRQYFPALPNKGWFFGFKLHGVCTKAGGLPDLFFTTGSVHDSQVVGEVTKDIEGLSVGDAGYLLIEFRSIMECGYHGYFSCH